MSAVTDWQLCKQACFYSNKRMQVWKIVFSVLSLETLSQSRVAVGQALGGNPEEGEHSLLEGVTGEDHD
jgi:hypothetical protein